MTGSPPHVIAGCFALAAFAVALVAGVASGNPAAVILLRALLAMMLCYPVGLVIGALCHRVIQQHLDAIDEDAKSLPPGVTIAGADGAGGAGGAGPAARAGEQRKEDVITV